MGSTSVWVVSDVDTLDIEAARALLVPQYSDGALLLWEECDCRTWPLNENGFAIRHEGQIIHAPLMRVKNVVFEHTAYPGAVVDVRGDWHDDDQLTEDEWKAKAHELLKEGRVAFVFSAHL